MKVFTQIASEPYRYDLFAVLRRLESHYQHLPRIGENAALRDEFIRVSQNPYFAFPASNLAGFERKGAGWRVFVQFLGQFGPQGALPLATTEEVYGWLIQNRDDAFPRFVDVFSNRFLQLFFRAWGNSRPIVQHDRPKEDRFVTYVGAQIGLGSKPFHDLDRLADSRKLALAGVLGAKAKSASRLRSALRALFDVKIEIDEFVGSRLALRPQDQSRLGVHLAQLGVDVVVGASFFSVQDKIRIRIFVRDLTQYRAFLPNGAQYAAFVDAVYFYIGDELEWDVELALPASQVTAVGFPIRGPGARLGGRPASRQEAPQSAVQLGWTSWLAPNWAAKDAWRRDARFHPTEISGRSLPRAPAPATL